MKKEFISFVLVGIINTIFYYALYSTLIYLSLDYRLAVLLATLVGVFFSFKTFGKYVFNNNDKKLIYKFIFTYTILYFSNIMIITSLEPILNNYYISGLIATICCAVLSFVLNKYYVFKEKKRSKNV